MINTKTQFKTIYLEDQVVLVDNSPEAEILKGDYCVHPKQIISKYSFSPPVNSSKIIAATPKLGDLPLLPLPDDEVDLSFPIWYSGMDKSKVQSAYKRFVKETGCKAATKTFTKENMIGFAEWIKNNDDWDLQPENFQLRGDNSGKSTEELLQIYIDQTTKPQFVPKMEDYDNENPVLINNIVPKIV